MPHTFNSFQELFDAYADVNPNPNLNKAFADDLLTIQDPATLNHNAELAVQKPYIRDFITKLDTLYRSTGPADQAKILTFLAMLASNHANHAVILNPEHVQYDVVLQTISGTAAKAANFLQIAIEQEKAAAAIPAVAPGLNAVQIQALIDSLTPGHLTFIPVLADPTNVGHAGALGILSPEAQAIVTMKTADLGNLTDPTHIAYNPIVERQVSDALTRMKTNLDTSKVTLEKYTRILTAAGLMPPAVVAASSSSSSYYPSGGVGATQLPGSMKNPNATVLTTPDLRKQGFNI